MAEQAQPARSGIDWSKAATTALVGLLAAVFIYQGIGEARRSGLVPAGEPAPAVDGVTLQGAAFDLSALRGQVVVVDFWATWCEACLEELPSLVKLSREYRDRGVVLVMADAASQDDPRAVARFAEQLAPDHPDNVRVVLADRRTLDRWRIEAFPTTYFIGKDGRISGGSRALTTEWSLRRSIESALQP
ncbi:MAG TPA: TlpA disulfide reductase family protein [Myxococcales bacterium]|jgi:thiol-disulfide isomerase/thioredoxin|nr:TlpA disulfide reductase family protein [Myxococcales bacterium]